MTNAACRTDQQKEAWSSTIIYLANKNQGEKQSALYKTFKDYNPQVKSAQQEISFDRCKSEKRTAYYMTRHPQSREAYHCQEYIKQYLLTMHLKFHILVGKHCGWQHVILLNSGFLEVYFIYDSKSRLQKKDFSLKSHNTLNLLCKLAPFAS